MIPKTQREALAVLSELCDRAPDVRLGQLPADLGFLGEDQKGRSLWDIDDEQLLSIMHRHRDELNARSADAAGKSTESIPITPKTAEARRA